MVLPFDTISAACAAGHGGPNAADYVRTNVFLNLLQNNKFISDLPGAVGELIRYKSHLM